MRTKNKIINKIILYFILVQFTAASSIFFMFLITSIFNNRVTGIGWGVIIGIVSGHIITSIYQKYKFRFLVLSNIIYSLLFFLFLYVISNFVYFGDELWREICVLIFLPICWEISIKFSLYVINKMNYSD